MTETAADSAKPPPVEVVGSALGRYRLGHELGRGAMGVVYAAFDPDLERPIALKVLRSAEAAREGKERLLREARAMARLAHPNVTSVYEVGTAGGRDFVAMELVHGETLAAWLRAKRRPLAAILAAFAAAGRGLAAAHAAGIVHRDFKPGNALRSGDGRIVVTDFGLARTAEDDSPEPDAAPAMRDVPLVAANGPATLTAPGDLLGTPPYMAPEQWNGGPITPATDQFAFCVALWEAITGERPYRGDRDEIRDQILRGPAALDASRIPRRFRRLLRRGLDPNPARRWPAMGAVIAQLERARLRRSTSLIALTLIATAAVLALRSATQGEATVRIAAACTLDDRRVAAVWQPAIAAELRERVPATEVELLDAAFHRWESDHERACLEPAPVAIVHVLCLNGVLERFEALRKAYALVPGDAIEALRAQLVDSSVCFQPAAPEVPQFTVRATPDVIASFALLARSETEHKPSEFEIEARLDTSKTDPCAYVIAALAFSAASNDARRAHALLFAAGITAGHCQDPRLKADLAIRDMDYHWEWPIGGRDAAESIAQAQKDADQVMQPELAAALAGARRTLARQRKQWDEAFRQSARELEELGRRRLWQRQLHAAIARNELRLVRSKPQDLEDLLEDARYWAGSATNNNRSDLAGVINRQAAEAGFWLGDPTAGAAWSRVALGAPPNGSVQTRTIHGTIVDDRRRPVANATVAVANLLRATEFDLASPLSSAEGSVYIATADAAGHFTITAPANTGAIIAEHAGQRSTPAALDDPVRLVLHPTRRIAGQVELHGTPHTQIYVRCVDAEDRTGRFYIVAPVGKDGSFSIDGASVGEVRVGVATKADAGIAGQVELQTVPASTTPITDLRLEVPVSTRTVDVLVQSALSSRLDGAQIIVVAGRHRFQTFGDVIAYPFTSRLDQFAVPVMQGDPALAAGTVRPGELVAHLDHVAPGDLTVCAIGFTSELLYPDVRARIQDRVTQLSLKCSQLGPDDAAVAISVIPQLAL